MVEKVRYYCFKLGRRRRPIQGLTPKEGGKASKAPSEAKKRRAPAWRKVFLEALRNTGNVTLAADTAGVHRSTAYYAKEEGQDFAERWEEAMDVAGATMEQEARRRAMEGVLEPVFYKGEPIGAIRKFSDTLLMFLLKGYNPKKYRENMRVERSGKVDTGPRKVEFVFRGPPVRPADPEPDTEEEPNG